MKLMSMAHCIEVTRQLIANAKQHASAYRSCGTHTDLQWSRQYGHWCICKKGGRSSDNAAMAGAPHGHQVWIVVFVKGLSKP